MRLGGAQKKRDSDTVDELLRAFKIFDTENKGVIEEKFMRFILCKMGEGLSDEEMDSFMKEASSSFIIIQDDTKYIKYPDFALYLKDQYQPPVVEDRRSPNTR